MAVLPSAWLVAAVAAIAFGCSGVVARVWRFYVSPPPKPAATHPPLRIALLGAASIAPHALLFPSLSLSEIVVVGVGARAPSRARELAERWGEHLLHGTYEQILASDQVDAVYIALINGAHHKWAEAALRAGKHVLCEKPLTSNAAEARSLERLARSRSLVLMEAYHNLHHPLATRMRELSRSGELGTLVSMHISSGLPAPDGVLPLVLSRMGLPPHLLSRGNASLAPRKAKMDASLGGGKFLSQGCYTVSMARWLLGADDEFEAVEHARMLEDKPSSRADIATDASLRFRSGVVAHLSHSSLYGGFDVTATFTNGSFTARNFLFPFLYHHLAVTRGGDSTFEQHYERRTPSLPADPSGCANLEGKRSWGAMLPPVFSCRPADEEGERRAPQAAETSFALQLRAFATAVRLHKLRAGGGVVGSIAKLVGSRREEIAALEADPSAWALDATGASSAVKNMEILDAIYEASGLGLRPSAPE